MNQFNRQLEKTLQRYELLLSRENEPIDDNGLFCRYRFPILTAAHTPISWRYDLNPVKNPYLLQRIMINCVFNSAQLN